MSGDEDRRPQDTTDADQVTSPDTTIATPADTTPKPRLPILILRDSRDVETAFCIDCDAQWTGRSARQLGSKHARRRRHRVAWTRMQCGEIRLRRWP